LNTGKALRSGGFFYSPHLFLFSIFFVYIKILFTFTSEYQNYYLEVRPPLTGKEVLAPKKQIFLLTFK